MTTILAIARQHRLGLVLVLALAALLLIIFLILTIPVDHRGGR